MRNTPRLLTTAVATVLVLAAVGCSSPSPTRPEPTEPEIQVSPLGVSRVTVEVSSDARAVAHVFGAFPDSCGSIYSTRQLRYENTVTATVLGQRPTRAICAAVVTPVQVDLVLEGMFFSGSYVVTVNGVTAAFSVP